MQFKQFYLGCLAHASYYIGSEGDAAIIDPQRDVQQYIDEATANNQKIKYIIETHSHADFVSGHLELAKKTGAAIIFGQRANTTFKTHKVNDGDKLSLGKLNLTFLETPGHTPEGITILVEDTENAEAPLKMFTGDTLFIGDVGRPDLVGSKGFSAEQMATMLYDSIYGKIINYADETEVYPAHGAGSLCGKSLSTETWSTLGEQKKTNYALKSLSKEEFIKEVTANQPEVPQYFPVSASQNLKGSASLDDIAKPEKLSQAAIEAFDGVVIDIRKNVDYGAGHIANTVNIGLGGQFASWAGTFISVSTSVALVATDENEVNEAFMRLARVGIESVKGYFLIGEYSGDLKKIGQVNVSEIKSVFEGDKTVQFVDVRRPAEHANGHAPGTLNIPLDKLPNDFERLNPELPTYLICQSGYRSSLGTSILENAGFKNVNNVLGGTKAWIEAGFETEKAATACTKGS